jgi:hypothetical protein
MRFVSYHSSALAAAGGVLNHKYAGEWAVRGAGVPFAVVRSTGAVPLRLRFT